ncbi:translesion error-prone DNA polymerase V autoproteolytic subunit [Oleiagrimonas sp. C23AA]|uniref:LexA family protein n=1 Tax=Oleiagrimonas sp. C23AA TaxID=2719047 RepID=UPI00142001C8|nr:translesion error-prone DNA polymerase V autoproteolytic subunit [Oleiagrimonas sp. C23AA]NII10665.1 translesion error-prone DNA polymerase V autoproteolytic subunit [Oleiagrimonas sp. C23AA]
MSQSSSSHGGARPGAGRPKQEPSKRISVPESQVPTVLAYLDAYRQPTRAGDPVPVSSSPTTLALPAFAHNVPAGFPSPADDYRDDEIDLNREMVLQGHEAATFVLRVSGWSMMGAGILDGDRIVVDRALNPQHGDIVVAIVNNELTIKRLGRVEGKLALIPENPHFQPLVLDEGDTMEIWGVVVSSLRTFKRGG